VCDEGQYRPAPRFAEWLMGLPHGWVTDPNLGLPPTEQLTALGNGVVPAQAIPALRVFVSDTQLVVEKYRGYTGDVGAASPGLMSPDL
jgi:hypothetical protein